MASETTLDVDTVTIRAYPTEVSDEVRRRYEWEFGEDPAERGGWYHSDDWARISYVYGRLRTGGDFLDVGVGAGQFVNLVAAGGRFRSVTGTDPTRFTKYREFFAGIDRHDRSVDDLGWPDDAFDVVTCMEVLEHVPEDVFERGLAELRRVCRGQLLMSVPFREPEPISATHVRRFVDDDIAAVFPKGSYTLLDRPRMPWMLIEERPGDPGWPAPEPSGADDATRVHLLEQELATLRNRRALRYANRAGSLARSLRRRATRLVRR